MSVLQIRRSGMCAGKWYWGNLEVIELQYLLQCYGVIGDIKCSSTMVCCWVWGLPWIYQTCSSGSNGPGQTPPFGSCASQGKSYELVPWPDHFHRLSSLWMQRSAIVGKYMSWFLAYIPSSLGQEDELTGFFANLASGRRCSLGSIIPTTGNWNKNIKKVNGGSKTQHCGINFSWESPSSSSLS